MTYNVGVFTKYVSDGSYQMIADMMTEGKADLVGISELDSCTVRTGRVFQLKKFAELMGRSGVTNIRVRWPIRASLRRRNRQP